ncbi:hypothetical protein D554_0426 [Bordetella holmesii 30539]|uniref:Uncharacterized protein n=2 Tax=Bordetella holmesii TaxID=35814 RepID=A0A158M692_9BORD|nr:hypothetical protein D560_0941 [Bordetella holmesii ATCC 51541]AIT25603.1 hypothetical protein D558_0923 [Bordetella holmesii 44057]EWM41968.1 hypothetical protein D556_0934 [Bordetella holmesii 41130]EWM46172.1 hypothetical protein D555_0945 [Bordetella holmesii 35009]EWM50326.1 hypothetical protein D557_0169 [Bordetella holmesii 70147]EXF89228.1 hypothetical protein D554_0426 [Bordetella holmesii 30539]EXX95434.1 hypothetical protein D559_2870 [Bordetella holmesii 1058]KAK70739.1 hypoth
MIHVGFSLTLTGHVPGNGEEDAAAPKNLNDLNKYFVTALL